MHLEPFVMHSALPARPQPVSHWSGVFNLLKFDRIAKKKEKQPRTSDTGIQLSSRW